MRKILEFVFATTIRFFVFVLSCFDRRVYTKFLERLCYRANLNIGIKDFVTLLFHPKKHFRQELFPVTTLSKTPAILIQGQIVREGNFTVETIRLYSKIFPESPLVVATWEGESKDDLKEIVALGAHLVLCKKTSCSGFLNFNLQRETTVAGLEAVGKLGVTQVLKTRSDQRIYNRFAIAYLQAMIIQFPSRNNNVCKGRIFIMSTTTLTNFPLHVCDMLQFGFLNDVCNFWKVSAHTENVERDEFVSEIEGRSRVSDMLDRVPTIPEVWLGRCYASLLYGDISLRDPKSVYLQMMQDVIGVIDAVQIDLFWPKYNSIEVFRDYQVPWILERFTFDKWLSLYMGTAEDIISYDPQTLI